MRTPSIEIPGRSLPEWILLAGLAGGFAEMLWVMLLAAVGPLTATEVAAQITATLSGALAHGSAGPALGILIHFLLSLAVATAFALVLWRPLQVRGGEGAVLRGAILTLAGVWVVNFFIVLPAINPAFVALMPLPATLVSKALFGIAMGAVLARAPAPERRAERYFVEHLPGI
jgi:hypothetical protein